MSTTKTNSIEQLLTLHHSLWDMQDNISYFGVDYQVYKPADMSYAQITVPGKSGRDISISTLNLNVSTYGAIEIKQAAKLGKTVRITLINEMTNTGFQLIGLIKTTPQSTIIERYTSYGTEVLYSTDPYHYTPKSVY